MSGTRFIAACIQMRSSRDPLRNRTFDLNSPKVVPALRP